MSNISVKRAMFSTNSYRTRLPVGLNGHQTPGVTGSHLCHQTNCHVQGRHLLSLDGMGPRDDQSLSPSKLHVETEFPVGVGVVWVQIWGS